MSKQEIIKIFGDRKIRSVWDDEAEKWIARRLKSIDIRKDLTDEWRVRGVEDERECRSA